MQFFKVVFLALFIVLLQSGCDKRVEEPIKPIEKKSNDDINKSKVETKTIIKKINKTDTNDTNKTKIKIAKEDNLTKIIKKKEENLTKIKKPESKIINYSGKYSYDYKGKDGDGARGLLEIFHSKDEISFKLELDSGAPSFNIGELDGKIKLKNENATYQGKGIYKKCTILFKFQEDIIEVKQNGTSGDCGFGMGIVASEKYKKEL